PRRVGGGGAAIRNRRSEKQPARFLCRYVIDSHSSPHVESLAERVIDAKHFLTAVEDALDGEEARGGGGRCGAVEQWQPVEDVFDVGRRIGMNQARRNLGNRGRS